VPSVNAPSFFETPLSFRPHCSLRPQLSFHLRPPPSFLTCNHILFFTRVHQAEERFVAFSNLPSPLLFSSGLPSPDGFPSQECANIPMGFSELLAFSPHFLFGLFFPILSPGTRFGLFLLRPIVELPPPVSVSSSTNDYPALVRTCVPPVIFRPIAFFCSSPRPTPFNIASFSVSKRLPFPFFLIATSERVDRVSSANLFCFDSPHHGIPGLHLSCVDFSLSKILYAVRLHGCHLTNRPPF